MNTARLAGGTPRHRFEAKVTAFVLQLNLFEVSDLADKLKMGSRAQEYIRGRMQNTSTLFYVYLLHFAAQV